jgi:hypothetical protein
VGAAERPPNPIIIAPNTKGNKNKIKETKQVSFRLPDQPPTEHAPLTLLHTGPIFAHGRTSDNLPINVVFDTGAGISILNRKFVTDSEIREHPTNITGISGKDTPIIGSADFAILLPGTRIQHNFLIQATCPVDCLIGNDILSNICPIIDYRLRLITLSANVQVPFEFLKIHSQEHQSNQKLTTIPHQYPSSSSDTSDDTDNPKEESTDSTEADSSSTEYDSDPAPSEDDDPSPVSFLTLPITFDAANPDKPCACEDSVVTSQPENNSPEPAVQQKEPFLTEEETKQLDDLIDEFKDVFATAERPIGRTNLCRLRLHTTGPPAQSRPYPVPIAHRHILKEEIDKMLRSRVIQPSSSDWTSPIVLAKKPDGTLRFCVDLRKLNKQLEKDKYPCPRIQDIIDQLSGNRYFSTLDFNTAYWQLEIDPADRHKTAFISPEGLYEFTCMPMGLATATSAFQRLMDVLFRGEIGKSLVVYIDDIVVMSKTFQEHLQHLRQTLMRIRDANLTIKRAKCTFAVREIHCLGFIVNEKGYRPSPKNVESVRNLPTPKKLVDVQQFLGAAGYYRRMIKHYSNIVQPLTNLLKKGVKFEWTQEHQSAFEDIKQKLCSYPVLTHYQPGLPTIIHCDASGKVIAAILLQISNKIEHPIAYESRKLTPTEQKWTITELEMLALCFALSKFRKYIIGTPFTVRTDHKALLWLRNFREELSPKLTRMAIKISEFGDFKIEHRKGTLLKDADGLSRLPARDPTSSDEEDTNISTLFVGFLTTPSLLSAQLTDPFVISTKNRMEDQPGKTKQFSINSELLFYSPLGTKATFRPVPVLPASLTKQVLEEFHSSLLGGHQGTERTFHRIRNNFYCPKMRSKVEKFVAQCFLCQRRKRSTLKPVGFLKSITPTDMFETIGIDFAGPYPETKDGQKYILVGICLFSKWIETMAVKDATAEAVINFLILKFISRHAFMRVLISDRGSQLTSKILRAALETLNVQHNLAAVQHHQTNGNAERTIRTINDMLAIFSNPQQNNWASVLPFATLAHNCSPSKTTGFSPFLTVYGREPRMPSTIGLPNEIPTLHRDFMRNLAQLRDKVREHITSAQLGQAKQYNKGRRIVMYNENDLVMQYKPTRKVGLNPKLQSHFYGPFRIHKVIDELNYDITPLVGPKAGKKHERVHVMNLKPYVCEELDTMDNEAISLPLAEKQDKEVISETIEHFNNNSPSPSRHGYNLRHRKQ